MEKSWTIYRHISPSGKVYVGITSQKAIYKRWGYGAGYKHAILFYRAILKYGWSNIKHEVLFTNLTESRAKSLEISLIRHYKNLGISYNITNGGEGTNGWCPSSETRDKMRLSKLGRKLSVATRTKMSEAGKGKRSGELNPMFGKFHTEETKAAMSIKRRGENNPRYGHSLTDSERETYRKAQACKPVIQLDPNTLEELREFSSQREAAIFVGGKSSHISECCRGIRKQEKRFKWKLK